MPSLLLRDALFYQTRTLYDPVHKTRQRAPASYGQVEPERVNGYSCNLGGHFLAAYAWRGGLWLAAETQVFPFDARLRIEVQGATAHQTLELFYGDKLEFSITYFLNQLPPSPLPTPFVGDEASDFGRFLAHLAAEPERQRQLLVEWNAPGV